MGTNSIGIRIVGFPDQAPNWRRDHPEVVGLSVKEAIIVRNGTISGNDTIDLVLIDAKGNQYVAMVTGNILKSITQITNLPGSY